ncbi:hypothetical protein Alsa4_CDS0259 [Staphylococcus phage Alsa_4]|nr:hypothetical protein Alsa4_CDS0259 [Staphylococcus phage Alsa_4]
METEEVTLLVDNSTLINWYPFNSLYHYRMDKDNKEILKLKGVVGMEMCHTV